MSTGQNNSDSSASAAAGVRKSVRKGTHSCIECRRRKTRCVFRPDNRQTCVSCLSRGTRCREQGQGDLDLPVIDSRPNLRDRVSRIENILETLLAASAADRQTSPQSSSSPQSSVNPETPREPRSQNNSHATNLPLTPQSIQSSDASPSYSAEQPLLSIFNNTILTSANDDDHQSPEATHGLSDETSSGFMSLGRPPPRREPTFSAPKPTYIRRSFRSYLPCAEDLDKILETTASWWSTWRPMFPEISAGATDRTLRQFVNWAVAQENPVVVAMGVLCIAVSLQQFRPIVDDIPSLPQPPMELMQTYLDMVDRLIVSDDEYAATFEGIEVMLLLAKTHTNLGHPRKGWLMFRRAISFSQLLGLHRDSQRNQTISREQRRRVWMELFQLDRYLALLFGFPYAVPDSCQPQRLEGALDIRRRLCLLAGRVVDRNQAPEESILPMTLEIGKEVDAMAAAMSGGPDSSKIEDRHRYLTSFIWLWQIKSNLYLPFLLQAPDRADIPQLREQCLEAFRQLMSVYHELRMDEQFASFMCKIMDYQCFIAAVVLILGLLGYGPFSASNSTQTEADWNRIRLTMDLLRHASLESSGTVAAQGLKVLETLHAARQNNTTSPTASWEGIITVPYLGRLKLSAGRTFNPPTSAPSSNPSPADYSARSVPIVPPPTHQDDPVLLPPPDAPVDMNAEFDPNYFELSAFDMDWQSLGMDMDIEESWNWYIDGSGQNMPM